MINEQEMQFADPDWKPTGSLSLPQGNGVAQASTPVSVAGSLDSQAHPTPPPVSLPAYDQGYQGAWPSPQPFSQKPFVPQMSYQAGATHGRGRSRRWIWVIVAILAFAMVSGMSGIFSMRSHYPSAISGNAAPMPEHKQVYAMQGATELDINDLSGNVVVKVTSDGKPNVVVVSAQGLEPKVNYQGQNMVFTSDDNITVYVPSNVALKLSGGVNDLEVDDFTGLLTAQTNSGQIILSNDNLSKGSSINTNSGLIDQEQGSVDNASITSVTGPITLNQVNLSGQVTVSTGGNGTITYTGGTLDPQGKYQFTTDSGLINLSLLASTAMHMKVTQTSGNFHSDFPPDTGNPPQASVGITTNSGDITINKM